MQDCGQYAEADKEMEEVMLKVLGKESVSGNGDRPFSHNNGNSHVLTDGSTEGDK
jgi:hypothetical protein